MQTDVSKRDDEPVAIYENEKRVTIAVRVPESTRAGLDDMVRLWRTMATARGDETDGIDLSHIVRKLLRRGIIAAFDEFGGRPANPEDWARIEAAIAKATKKSR